MVPVPVPEFPDVTWIQNWFDCADHEQLLPVTVTVDCPELPAAGDVMATGLTEYAHTAGGATPACVTVSWAEPPVQLTVI